MSLSIEYVLKELEDIPTSIGPLSETLHSSMFLNSISASETKHLVSRILKLARAHDEYKRWYGVNLMKVIGEDYKIISSEGVSMINVLIKIIETSNSKSNVNSLKSAIECLNSLLENTRGKPVLTREITTPRLPSIISAYIDKIQLQPLLIINSLKKLLLDHPTTFRTFGNKLRSQLITIATSDSYVGYSSVFRESLSSVLASLVVIEKDGPPEKWNLDVVSLIGEIIALMDIYKEFLKIKEDKEMGRQFQRLFNFCNGCQSSFGFPSLDIDVNESSSILKISDRMQILTEFLSAYLTSKTTFVTKVPLGAIVSVVELVCAIDSRFIPFRAEIYDKGTRLNLEKSIKKNQGFAVKLLTILPIVFGLNVVPYLSSSCDTLSTLIPYERKSISKSEVYANEVLMTKILDCISEFLNLSSSVQDNIQLARFIEMALVLLEQADVSESTQGSTANNNTGSKHKAKKAKVGKEIPLSDIISHKSLFVKRISKTVSACVHHFFQALIDKAQISSNLYSKILRVIISTAVEQKTKRQWGGIDPNLRELVLKVVLHPGLQEASLLPMISSILDDDPLISVFNNPRFPPVTGLLNQKKVDETDDSDDSSTEEAASETKSFLENASVPPAQNLETEIVSSNANNFVKDSTSVETFQRTEEELVKKHSFDSHAKDIKSPKRIKVEYDLNSNSKKDSERRAVGLDLEVNVQPSVLNTQIKAGTENTVDTATMQNFKSNFGNAAIEEGNSDSDVDAEDFEMPEIDIDDDSDASDRE